MKFNKDKALHWFIRLLSLLLLTVLTVLMFPFSEHQKDIILHDEYIVDSLIYTVSKQIIDRVNYLCVNTNLMDYRYKRKFRHYFPLELIQARNGTFIFRFKSRDKHIIFKYVQYTNHKMNEVEITREVEHEAIVKTYYSFYTDDNVGYFIVTEPMECALTIEYATKYPDEIGNIVKTTVDALKYLHGIDIIHCDIKLNNILVKTVNNKKVYKLCDFGGSFYINSEAIYPSFFTYTESYVAPEIYFQKKFMKSSDVWSLGHMIWFYIEKNVIFEDVFSRFDQQAYNKYLLSETQIYGHHKALELVRKCCTKEPNTRASLDDIHDWLNQHSQ